MLVSLSVAVNHQVHTAMSVLLRLLPLLVVGCLLLQSLQPTAVSGENISNKDDKAITYEDYALTFGNYFSAQIPTVCQICIKLLPNFILLQTRQEANDRLEYQYSSCKKGHVEEQLPFKFDDSRTKEANIMTLCQDGYIIRYSTERKTPLFTAQRMDGAVRNAAIAKVRNNSDSDTRNVIFINNSEFTTIQS